MPEPLTKITAAQHASYLFSIDLYSLVNVFKTLLGGLFFAIDFFCENYEKLKMFLFRSKSKVFKTTTVSASSCEILLPLNRNQYDKIVCSGNTITDTEN